MNTAFVNGLDCLRHACLRLLGIRNGSSRSVSVKERDNLRNFINTYTHAIGTFAQVKYKDDHY